MYSFEFSARTTTGRRAANQDACLAVGFGDGLAFLAVADGMGGHAGGEIASATVIDAVESFFEDKPLDELAADLKETLRRIVGVVAAAVRERIAAQPALTDMGSTLVCALVHRDRYVVANIGDSRLYAGKPRSLRQITKDHSYIREFLDAHPEVEDIQSLRRYANIITRAVDGSEVEPDIFPTEDDSYRLRRGEYLLLCSDGLIPDKLDSPEASFGEILRKGSSLKESADVLVNYAHEAGSTDNITVVLGLYRGGRKPFMQRRFIGE